MTYRAPVGTSVGHVHLKVADLDRAVRFYRDVLGFEVTATYGTQAAFLGIDGYHHQLGLNTWSSQGGTPAPRHHTGLYHVAFVYPRLNDLREAVARVAEHGVDIYGAADHGVSVALYFDDPDGNGIELYWDRPRDQWPHAQNGDIAFRNTRFDVDSFIAGRTELAEA
ncbi:MAG: VOC family protein [Pseudomonadota bacterium]